MSVSCMFRSDGLTVKNAAAPPILCDGIEEIWTETILELRGRVKDAQAALDLGTPTWTRGTTTDLGTFDGFYVSHVQDIRDKINGMETLLGIQTTVWAIETISPRWYGGQDHPGANFTDVRTSSLVNELHIAMEGIEVFTGGWSSPTNVRVLVAGAEVAS